MCSQLVKFMHIYIFNSFCLQYLCLTYSTYVNYVCAHRSFWKLFSSNHPLFIIWRYQSLSIITHDNLLNWHDQPFAVFFKRLNFQRTLLFTLHYESYKTHAIFTSRPISLVRHFTLFCNVEDHLIIFIFILYITHALFM